MVALPTDIAAASFLHWPETKALLAVLPEVRFVGGCVRDSLLGREVKDIDLTTTTLPEEMMHRLSDAGIAVYPTGIDHGTVTARIGEAHFQITTLREDVACDGRHAQVTFSQDWKKDALRRDFTINALYAEASGKVVDMVGGLADIRARALRFIGNPHDRIVEDGLRILRFFRFAATLGFAMESTSLAACINHAKRLDILSGERIREELFTLLERMETMDALALMIERGVLQPVLASPLRLPPSKAGLPVIALAWMLEKGDAHAVSHIRERLRLSNAEASVLEAVVMTPAPSTLAEAKKLLRRVGEVKYAGIVTHAAVDEPIRTLHQHWSAPEFPVRGADLLALGHTAGEALGQALAALEKAWEQSDYQLSKAELLEKLRQA